MVDSRFYNIAKSVSLLELATHLGAKIIEPKDASVDLSIYGIADISSATDKDLAVFTNKKYKADFLQTKAGACLVGLEQSNSLPTTYLLQVDDPYYSYSQAIHLFYSPKIDQQEFSPYPNSCYIAKSAKIGKNLQLGCNVVIEDGVEIGDDCFIDSGSVIKVGVKIGNRARIFANSTIAYSIIGDNFILLSGARIGQDGYGFATYKGIHHKIFHVGRVIIGNDVEIGSNATIDRGSISDTIIGNQSKIDNLVQLGHNVQLGQGCLIVAQVGIAGSTILGNYCALGGQVGVAGHLKIADLTKVAAQSGVGQDIFEKGAIVGGYPAVPIVQWHKQTITLQKLANRK